MKKTLSLKITKAGLMLALALIVSLLENMLPPVVPVLPYAKIGFSNIILLVAFFVLGTRDGVIVLLLKNLLMAVFAGNISALIWSLPASIVAYLVMILLLKTRIFSIVGVSALGGVCHNVVQILVAMIVVSPAVATYLPYMILAGAIAGIFTGFVTYFLVKIMPNTAVSIAREQRKLVYHRQDTEDIGNVEKIEIYLEI